MLNHKVEKRPPQPPGSHGRLQEPHTGPPSQSLSYFQRSLQKESTTPLTRLHTANNLCHKPPFSWDCLVKPLDPATPDSAFQWPELMPPPPQLSCLCFALKKICCQCIFSKTDISFHWSILHRVSKILFKSILKILFSRPVFFWLKHPDFQNLLNRYQFLKSLTLHLENKQVGNGPTFLYPSIFLIFSLGSLVGSMHTQASNNSPRDRHYKR